MQEDIRTAINGQIHEENEDKEDGNDDLLKTYLEQLKEALDNFDISACEDVLSELSKFEWEDDKGEDIATIKDMIAMYEYDEAIAVIDKIMKYSSALVF